MTTELIKTNHTTPNSSFCNSHYYCDYIEFLALINNDIVSSSDVYDRFSEDNKINFSGDKLRATTDDKWNARIADWFTLLEVRQEKFKESYPFDVKTNKITLKQDLDNAQYTYVFLLLSSTRRHLNDHNLLTTDFEAISYQVLKSYLPSFSHVYQFGKTNIEHERYKGHITNKIDLLANDLMCKTKYEDHFFAKNNSGDGGLDLVAWVPFNKKEDNKDINHKNIQVYLGQCATGEDWLNKQDDTNKFPNKYITFNGCINYIMFIPFDGRNPNSTFNEDSQMGTYLLFDRFRLLSMLDNYNLIETIPSFEQVVKKVVEFEQDIV